MISMKTLDNTGTALKNPGPVEIHGNPGAWVCVCKASSQEEGWMKSTKVMAIRGGCLVQVSTQQGDHVAEALTFVPGVTLNDF